MLATPTLLAQNMPNTTGSDVRLLLPPAGKDATASPAWNALDGEQDSVRASMTAYAAFVLDQQGMYCQA